MGNLKLFLQEEDAIGVVEIILILVILIALVLIFKTKITSVVNKAFKSFTDDSTTIIG
ncbi:MAG: holin, BlyA family protein [Lachnospiraceae bacterium]|nr:holin, BlyA family protein [Lachnospiraceae bacterium]